MHDDALIRRRDMFADRDLRILCRLCGCHIIELIKAGIGIDACRTYLTRHAPALAALFEDAIAKAAAEE